jgi:phospho-N-acetylmuramoyl-pentapeptide-transferase
MSAWEVAQGFWWGFLPAAILAWPVYLMLIKTKSRQTVSEFAPEGHAVKQGTPTMGGLIVILGLIPSMAYFYWQTEQSWWTNSGSIRERWWGPALLLLLSFGLIGIVDDYLVPKMMPGKRGLGWKQKLLMQVLFALAAGNWMFGAWTADSFITAFCILFFANAYNFADGLDGLAGSLLLGLAFGVIGIASLRPVDATTAPLMAAMCGAIVPFLFLNAPPAKLFMGDVGSLPIGALIGGAVCELAFRNHPVEPGTASLWGFNMYVLIGLKVLSLMMAIELIPVPLQILWVKAFKKKLFPFTPIHHAFEKAGWKETRVVAVFALVQLLLSVLAITLVATAA